MTQFFTTARDGGILIVTLNDPDSAVNIVSPGFVAEMTALFASLKDDDSVTGVIVISAKPGFMAGADLKYILRDVVAMPASAGLELSRTASAMHRVMETCGKPVVAALNGFALGGGYEFALACTHRILADAPGAVVGLPEVNVGLLPGSGGTQRLPRMVPMEVAAAVLLEGASYSPAKALALGLVDEVVAPDALLASARAWLATSPNSVRPWDVKGFVVPESDGLLKQSTAGFFTAMTVKLAAKYGGNYPAPLAILTCLFEGIQVPFDKGLAVETRQFAHLTSDPVSRNVIRTAFVNKQAAQKGARRPAGVKKTKVEKLAMLGGGMMGAGIAYCAAKSGIEVVVLDSSDEAAAKGKAYSEMLLDRQVERGTLSEAAMAEVLARITPTTCYDDLAGAGLVIEAVFEDKTIKADVTAKAIAVLGPDILFASNTSTLPITGLAEALPRPDRFIGLHFFSPVDRMELVEVIRGAKTSDETLANALDFVAQIRKVPIVVNDSRGFYTSRVFQTFIHEGMLLLSEGVAPALIENAAKQAGMPVGPLAVCDETSISLPLQIVREAESQDPAYVTPASKPVMVKMVEDLGRLGRKGGGGFYEYVEKSKRLWPGLADHFPLAAEQPDVEEVKRRLLYVQSLDTVRCLEEGVLTHPADGDLGAVLGWSFPGWTGGTLSLIETVGAAEFVARCDYLAQRFGPRFTPPPLLRDMAQGSGTFAW